jgi:hypothetical protein
MEQGIAESPYISLISHPVNETYEFFGPFLNPQTKHESIFSPVQFGCFTGLLLIAFSNEKLLNRYTHLLHYSNLREFCFVALCFLIWMLFMPLTLSIFGGFYAFKVMEESKLKKSKPNFKGILNGEDVVWACEDVFSKSIINVVAYVGAPSDSNEHFSKTLLSSIKDRIFTELMAKNPYPKLFYRRRKSESGYFYWTDEKDLTVDDYVRLTELTTGENVLEEDVFKREMSGILDKPLPDENSALWECLVGQQMIKVGGQFKYPVILQCFPKRCELIFLFILKIIFRVHHSVGDGVALLRLLLETVSDKENYSFVVGNPLLSRCQENASEKLNRIAVNVITFVKLPSVLFSHLFLKAVDENRIHPKKLSGSKVMLAYDTCLVLIMFSLLQQP